jgi:hypothetical protein
MGITPPAPGTSPHRDTVENLNCGVDFARWALASWSVGHITAQATSGEPIGSAAAQAKPRVPRLRSGGPAWRIVATAFRTRDAASGVFPHRLASGSCHGPQGRALLGRPGEGRDRLAQALSPGPAPCRLTLAHENLNWRGLPRTPGQTWPTPPGSSSVLVMLFKRDALVCKGFSERCLQNAPAA